jgi:Skp family chaperone for outer membrane proteins
LVELLSELSSESLTKSPMEGFKTAFESIGATTADLRQAHLLELDRMKDAYAAQLQQMKDACEAQLQQTKDAHSAEVQNLKDTHKKEQEANFQHIERLKEAVSGLTNVVQSLVN